MADVIIAFPETAENWDTFCSYRRNHCPELEMIPVTPEVDYLAERAGSRCQSLDCFFDQKELNSQGDRNIRLVEDLSDDFDSVLHSTARWFLRHEWVSLRAFFHPIKIAVDRVSLRLIPILKVFEEIKPQGVVCVEPPAPTGSGIDPLAMNPTFLTSRLIPLLASQLKNCAIVHVDKHGNARQRPGMHLPKQSRQLATSQPTVWARTRIAVDGLWRSMFSSTSKDWSEDTPQPLLIHSIFSEFGTKFVDDWCQKGYGEAKTYDEVFRAQPIPESRLQYARWVGTQLWHSLTTEPLLRRHFVIRQFDCFDLLTPLFQYITEIEIPNLLLFARVAETALRRPKRTVIIAGGMIHQNYIIAKAAEALRIPFVTTHFGGYMGYCDLPLHERYDRGGADYFICGGTGAASSNSQPSPLSFWRPETKFARPVAVGLPWLDELVHRYRRNGSESTDAGMNNSAEKVDHGHEEPGGLTVMYVMSAMVGDLAYLGYVFVPDITVWRFQCRVVEAFERHPSVRLILKPPLKGRYPQVVNPLFEWLACREASNVSVLEQDIPFSEIMDKADAFIIDNPATPLLQAVATTKPLLVFSDKSVLRMYPEAAALLRKRAMLAESEIEFFDMLEKALHSNQWHFSWPVNDEFLTGYGVHLNDGGSAERLASFLLQITCGQRYSENDLCRGILETGARDSRRGVGNG